MDILPVKTYYNNKEKIMKVFYRVKDCHELLVTEVPFEPYCYAEIKPENLSSVKHKYRMIGSEVENFAKVKLSYDEAKKIIESKETKLAEADLKPETRFIIDNYGNEEWTKDILPRIFYIDTEFEVNNGMLPSWQEIDNTFNAITIFDTYTNKFYSWFVIPSSKYDRETLPSQIHQRFKDDNILVSDKEIEMYFFNNEKQLVNHLFDWFIAHTPDIITAWNSPFDIPCLMRRFYNHKGMKGIKQISPFAKVSSKILFSIENDVDVPFDQIIPGISVIDYLELYKKNTQVGKQSYALDAIAEEEIKQRKVKYKGNLDQLYREDFVLFCCYNIFDVDLVKKIDDKRKLLTITIDIRNLSKCEYEDILKMSHVIDNLFLLEAKNRRANGENIVLPNKNYKDKDKNSNIDEDFDDYLGSILNIINNKNNSIFKNAVLKVNETTRKIKERYLNEDDEQENDQFCGAYVKEPIPGRYAKLSDVDFASLYPSIMINFNLSPETYVGMVLNYDYLNELRVKKTFNDNSFNFLPESDNITLPITSNRDFIYVRLKNNEEITFNNIKEIKRWCKQNNYNIVGNGAIFDQKIENAIMPHIVKKLLEDRATYKKKKIEAKQAGNDTLAAGYDTIQNALKVAANSSYGSISLSIFRLFSLPIAEGITTTGQMIIKSSGYMLNNYINSLSDIKKDYIVYTDTDSLIFTCDTLFPDIKEYTKENIDKILVFTKSCQDFVNESIAEISNEMFFRYVNKPSVLKVKTEYFAKSAIYTSKKHYSMLKVYEDGIYEESLFNVGISLKRSSYNTKTKEFVELILRKILNFDDKNINDIILNEVNNIRKVYTLEDLGIPCGIKRLDLYTTAPINVRAAEIFNKYISRKNIDNISSGKLRYIYVKAWNNKIDLNRQIDKFNVVAWFPETKYIDIIAKEITIDHDKMIDRMIINTIKPFFEAMNWKIPDKELKSKANKSFCKFMRKG